MNCVLVVVEVVNNLNIFQIICKCEETLSSVSKGEREL